MKRFQKIFRGKISYEKKKKKEKIIYFHFYFSFIVLGAISFSLDPDGFGDNVYQVGRGFVYIIF